MADSAKAPGRATGSFRLQGAVGSLDLPVLPRAVRFDEDLSGVELADVGDRPPGCPDVVGRDPFDFGDAMGMEVGGPTANAVGPLLVGQNLGVRQPRMIGDERMYLVKPAAGLTV
jgi:hypothetical protein